MKIAIIGSNGQLAFDLARVWKDETLALLTHGDVSVEDREELVRVLREIGPDVIVNTAAYHKVDLCEDQPGPSFDVNCMGALNGAIAANETGARYVFYSTDYVYGSDESRTLPYAETDSPGPVNLYGWSKLAGEMAVQAACPRHFVIRSCGLYGVRVSGKGYNFPGLMLKLAGERDELKVVHDQRLTPTSTLDLARTTADLIRTDHYGLYHATNEGDCTWYEFTREILALTGSRTKLTAVTSNEFPTRAKRPPYSVLQNRALERAGLPPMKPWGEALKHYLQEIKVI